MSQRQKKPINFEDLGYVEKDSRPKGYKTTAWNEAVKKCEKIVATLMKNPSSEILSRPPDSSHMHYLELMNDYIDLSIIERNLREGYYYGTFSFI